MNDPVCLAICRRPKCSIAASTDVLVIFACLRFRTAFCPTLSTHTQTCHFLRMTCHSVRFAPVSPVKTFRDSLRNRYLYCIQSHMTVSQGSVPVSLSICASSSSLIATVWKLFITWLRWWSFSPDTRGGMVSHGGWHVASVSSAPFCGHEVQIKDDEKPCSPAG